MFEIRFTDEALQQYEALRDKAATTTKNRAKSKKTKASKDEGLFNQVKKTIQLLGQNPRHPGLRTHEYSTLENPFDPQKKVWEAYAQNNTPGAYRVFWCYGPQRNQITIVAITPHP